MGRLTQLRPLVAQLGSAIAGLPTDERGRDRQRDQLPWRRWYKTARWQRLRMWVLERDHFTCRMCGRLEGDTAQLVADHRRPHRGNARLFWDPRNLWTLCKTPCHDSVKQREERGAGI